ncbi:MAG: diacylglycerol kinase family protein, partial [Clostridia bacterium]|nr:diacylglycerol kinase family protein [Clostridia bacterium]
MSIYHVFYNGKANNGKGLEEADELKSLLPGDEFVFSDVTADTYENLFKKAGDGTVILCGGDGTINRFVNATKDIGYKNEILYFATGSGNDFLKDTGKKKGELVALNKYIEKLPEVTVGGKTYKFLNNVGFGIDGYCCEVGDKLRATSDKPIDYTGIAIKGLLFYYKPVNATVTVDGVTTEYK